MAQQCCPTCGRAFKTPKAVQMTDVSTMTPAELFAYRHKTAPVEDVRFALRTAVKMSAPLRDDWQALLSLAPTIARAETYRRLTVLQARWRAESNGRRIPAVGSPAWAERQRRIDARLIAEEAQRVYLAPTRHEPGRRTDAGWTKPRTYRGRLARKLVA